MLPALVSRTVIALVNPPGSKEPIAAPIAAPMAPTTILSGDSSATRLPLVVPAIYTAGACAVAMVLSNFSGGPCRNGSLEIVLRFFRRATGSKLSYLTLEFFFAGIGGHRG